MAKICMLSTGHSPLDDRIYYKEALSLSKKYESVVLVMPGDQSDFRDTGNRVEFVPLGRTGSLLSRFLLIPKAVIRVFRIRPDICHFHDFELIFALPLLKLLPGCRIIYDVHEVYPEMIMQSGNVPRIIRGILAKSVDAAERILSRLADCIVASDDNIADRFYDVHSNVSTIYNYPELNLFIPEEEKMAQLKDRYRNRTPIIYQGSISEERGLFLMIEAMEKIKTERPDVILLLVGSMSSSDLNRAREEISKRTLEDHIEIIGWVSHKDIVNYIKISRIGLVPLLPTKKFMKNVPIKQFEYMACGVPVLGACLPPVKTYILSCGCGEIFDSTSSEALAGGVVSMLGDEDKMRKMSEAGKKATSEMWNWDKMEERLFAVYEDLHSA